MNDYFRIEFPDGTVTYEPRNGVLPSAKMRELAGTGAKVGMTMNPPKEVLVAYGERGDIAAGDTVDFIAYGVMKRGRVIKVGRKHARVEIGVGKGTTYRTKEITRPIDEMRRVRS